MARGGRPQRGAKRGAPARPGPRYRQTKLNFSRQRSRPEIRQPSQTDRDTMVSFSEPEYAQADSTDEESEDKDSVVRRQVKAREPLRGATTHDARWRKHMESGQNAKNSGLESFNTLRIRETDMSEDGEVEDEWDREVQTGEIPPYPVRRPYYLGGMGRYGIDIPIEGQTLSRTKPDSATQRKEAAIDTVLTPFSRVTFQTDSVIYEVKTEGIDPSGHGWHTGAKDEDLNMEENSTSNEEGDTSNLQSRLSTPPSSSSKSEPNQGAYYVFQFGKYRDQPFSSAINDVSYLKTIGGQRRMLDKQVGLRAAFEYYCPQYIKDNPLPDAQASNSVSVTRSKKGGFSRSHPENYKWDFGQFKNKRFAQAPRRYLKLMDKQVQAGKCDDRKGLRAAFEWHRWGGKQAAGLK